MNKMELNEIYKNMERVAAALRRGEADDEQYGFKVGQLYAYSNIINTQEAKNLYKTAAKEAKEAREAAKERRQRYKEIRTRMEEIYSKDEKTAEDWAEYDRLDLELVGM